MSLGFGIWSPDCSNKNHSEPLLIGVYKRDHVLQIFLTHLDPSCILALIDFGLVFHYTLHIIIVHSYGKQYVDLPRNDCHLLRSR